MSFFRHGIALSLFVRDGKPQMETNTLEENPAIDPVAVFHHYPIHEIPQSLSVECGSLREPLANDLLRERIAHIGEQIEWHKRNSISTPI